MLSVSGLVTLFGLADEFDRGLQFVVVEFKAPEAVDG